jgi:hypothetical protein
VHRVVTHSPLVPENKKARADRAAGRSLFSICLTWLQAAANHHGIVIKKGKLLIRNRQVLVPAYEKKPHNASVVRLSVLLAYAAWRRRLRAAITPASPLPKSTRLIGSGVTCTQFTPVVHCSISVK